MSPAENFAQSAKHQNCGGRTEGVGNQNYSFSGLSCSKLTTTLVNNSLKFTSSDMQIC